AVPVAGGCLLAGAPENGEDGISAASVGRDGVERGDRLIVLALLGEREGREKTIASGGRTAVLPPLPGLVATDRHHDQDGEPDDIGSETVPQPLVLLVPEVFVDFAKDIG